MTAPASRPRVAVVGSGASGLTAALGLQDDCEVILYESGPRLGGHILPAAVERTDGGTAHVDTAFVVFVPETYPTFTKLLGALAIEHARARTQFRVDDELHEVAFEPAQLLSLCGKKIPKACRGDLLRVHKLLTTIRKEGMQTVPNVPLQTWAQDAGFQRETLELGIVPWVASFWGLQPRTVLTVSAPVALREMARNAGPLRMHRVVPSTQVYKEAFLAAVGRAEIRREHVERIELESRPVVHTDAGAESFDRVVCATSAEVARTFFGDAREIQSALAPFNYESSVAVLHTDPRDLPPAREDWRTFHHRRRQEGEHTHAVTTWVMDLLHEWEESALDIDTPTLLSTGDPTLVDRIDAAKTREVFEHRHLVMTPQVVDAVPGLHRMFADGAIALTGAYASVGALHEDAIVSGARAAALVRESLGLAAPAWPWAGA